MGCPWSWITGFAVLGMTANVVFLIGCISPATKDLALYRVNVTLLADGLQRLAVVDSGNETDLLRSPELPTWWYWGISGMCDIFEATGETRCRRAFPPTDNLMGILEDSLRDSLGDDQEKLTGIVSSWNATLNKINPSRLAAKEGKFAAQSKASAALAIIAIVVDVATILLALCLQRKDQKERLPYSAAFVSALITIAAGTLAVLSMGDGVHGAIDTGEHGGAGIIILFVGAGLRVLACGGSATGSSNSNSKRETGMTRNEEIGFAGERHIYTWLQGQLPGWSYENWTSKLRKHANYPEFTEPEYLYSDFTYEDGFVRMPQVLGNAGVPVSPHWSAGTRYHLEVKSTPAGCDAEFFVSEHQVRLMRRYADDPRNAYILARVFHVERAPAIRFFREPWSHPGLAWGPLGGDGYYPVQTIS